MMVKVLALAGDNTASGLLLEANYQVHHGPDAQGRVLVFDVCTDSFRTLHPPEYREVPDPRDPHALVRITQEPDGWRAGCICIWRADLAAGDPDGAVVFFQRRHLERMAQARAYLTNWGDPRFLQSLHQWHQQHWRRRQEPER